MKEPPYGPMVGVAPDPVLPQALSDSASVHELAQVILTEMQQDIDARIDWRLQQGGRRQLSQEELGMALGSLGIAIPLSAIAAAAAGLAGIALVWIGVVLVNMAWATRR